MVQTLAHLSDHLWLPPCHVVVLSARRTVIAVVVTQKDDQVLHGDVQRGRDFFLKLCHFLSLGIYADLFCWEGVRATPVIVEVVFILNCMQVYPVGIVLLKAALFIFKLQV